MSAELAQFRHVYPGGTTWKLVLASSTHDLCEVRAALWTCKAVLVPIPLIGTLVAKHHVAAGGSLRLRPRRLIARLVHGRCIGNVIGERFVVYRS